MENNPVVFNNLLEQASISVEPDPDNARPAIVFHRDIGKHFDTFDVNEAIVAQRMVDEGISDRAIAERTIIFDAHRLDKTTGVGSHRLGKHDKKTGEVTLSVPSHVGLFKGKNKSKTYTPQSDINKAVDHALSTTLFHELRHVRQDDHEQRLNTKYNSKNMGRLALALTLPAAVISGSYEFASRLTGYESGVTGMAVAGLGFVAGLRNTSRFIDASQKEIYRNRPSEVDARQAELDWKQYPSFVQTRLK